MADRVNEVDTLTAESSPQWIEARVRESAGRKKNSRAGQKTAAPVSLVPAREFMFCSSMGQDSKPQRGFILTRQPAKDLVFTRALGNVGPKVKS
jgi:hypothetical protein